jgi:arginine-tRNA-protein transferase
VTDLLPNGLSAVYTFTNLARAPQPALRDPVANRRKPAPGAGSGVPRILDQELQKMNYKTQYRPIELLINQRWVILN